MIDRFHKDPEKWIFLISTLAGGTGLNLVGANKVVIFGEFPLFSLATVTHRCIDPNWSEHSRSFPLRLHVAYKANRQQIPLTTYKQSTEPSGLANLVMLRCSDYWVLVLSRS